MVLRTTEQRALQPAREQAQRELEQIDQACSRFREDSELSRVNANAGRPVEISHLFTQALGLALRGAELTDGAVDPTIGRYLELAGYDRDWRLLERCAEHDRGRPTLTDDRRPAQAIVARPHSGWRTVALDTRRRRVRVPAGIRLDLGASAKGWAADRAARAGARATGRGVLVSIGGDIATCGDPPAEGWLVRVTDDHRAPLSAPGQTVTIRSGGLATSSTTVRRWRQGAADMHHIIDPRTGTSARGAWRTVSVAAASCADANIAATAAIVRADTAAAWLTEHDLPARLVGHDGGVLCVGDWPTQKATEEVCG
ncbi:MAG TPA: FAD:protein FMN transferase [Solirubrobacteraceae bacterium]